MGSPKPARRGGQDTGDRILETALKLFRKKGFGATTMRDIAAACELSLGAAYYYFPSKEALVLDYYRRREAEHADKTRATLASRSGLAERIAAVLHIKLDVLTRDRRLLGTLIQGVGEPDNPLGVFADETRDVREHGIALFREALAGTPLPDDLTDVLPRALWMLHLGILLYFLHDKSPRQEKTRALTDGLVALLVPLIQAANLPLLAPVRAQLMAVLAGADLVPRTRPA
jgi:AcrR family transcriptional regulator